MCGTSALMVEYHCLEVTMVTFRHSSQQLFHNGENLLDQNISSDDYIPSEHDTSKLTFIYDKERADDDGIPLVHGMSETDKKATLPRLWKSLK